jgi:hypothetical protein
MPNVGILTKLTCKGTLRQVFYLSEAHFPYYGSILLPPSPLTHCILVYNILIHTGVGGVGELSREKVRGALVHKTGSEIPPWLTVSPVYKLYETPVKTTFRVWCLYSYSVFDCHLYQDLKQYMDDCGAILAMNNVKLFLFQVPIFPIPVQAFRIQRWNS